MEERASPNAYQSLASGDGHAIEAVRQGFRIAIARAKRVESVRVRDQAELMVLLLDAQAFTARYVDTTVLAANPEFPWEQTRRQPPQQAFDELEREWKAWTLRAQVLIATCHERGDLRMACDARLLLVSAEVILAKHRALLQELLGGRAGGIDPRHKNELSSIISAARKLHILECELRAELELAELEDAFGDAAAARQLAERVQRKASLCHFAALARIAGQLANGESTFSIRRSEMRAAREAPDEDWLYLTLVNEKAASFADVTCETLGVPRNRAGNVLSSVRAHHLAAVARRDFCRYFAWGEPEITVPSEAFRSPSLKRICCMKFDHRSQVPHTDLEALTEAFKRSYCASCTARAPREP